MKKLTMNVSVTEFHRRKHEWRVDILNNNEKLLDSAVTETSHNKRI